MQGAGGIAVIFQMKMKSFRVAGCLSLVWAVSILFSPDCLADGNVSYIVQGAAKVVFSIFEIPKAMVDHSQTVVFPFGLVTGALEGAFRTVGGTLNGAFDIARGAAPLAKYAIFFV